MDHILTYRKGSSLASQVLADGASFRLVSEADIILWDGGNNDTPFIRPNLEIVVVDPHRPGHELSYYPGKTNFLRADVLVINKVDSAPPEGPAQVESNISIYNPQARVIRADSETYPETGPSA